MHGVQSYFGGTTATATTDSLFQISGVPATVTTDRTGDVPATVTTDIMFYPGIILAPITTSSSSAKLELTSDTFLWTQSAQILPGIRRRKTILTDLFGFFKYIMFQSNNHEKKKIKK